MQVLPDCVVHVFGTLCSRGCDPEDGNPKPTCGNMTFNILWQHHYIYPIWHYKMSWVTTWGLAEAKEAMASREARVAAIFKSDFYPWDCERLMLGRFELRFWRKTAIWTGGRQAGKLVGFSSENQFLLPWHASPTPRVSPLPQASAAWASQTLLDFSNQKLPNYGQLSQQEGWWQNLKTTFWWKYFKVD